MTPPTRSRAASSTISSTASRGATTATQSGFSGSESRDGKQRRSPIWSYLEFTR